MDDLYDILDANKELPVKYFMMLKDKDIKPKDFTLQNKLFRKFFYENSSSLDDVTHFVEITNQNIAKKVGITGKDQIVVVQNKNKYSKLEGG